MILPTFQTAKVYIVALSFIASVLGTAYFTSNYKEGQFAIKQQTTEKKYIEDLKKSQDDYNERVKALNDSALKTQTELAKVNSELERKYDTANKKANDALGKYNSLIRDGWRLRDPGTSNGSVQLPNTPSNSVPGAADSGNVSTSGAELSREASEFLLNFATDADKVVEQLLITQEYAKRLKEICQAK
jgi:hypothetical protein